MPSACSQGFVISLALIVTSPLVHCMANGTSHSYPRGQQCLTAGLYECGTFPVCNDKAGTTQTGASDSCNVLESDLSIAIFCYIKRTMIDEFQLCSGGKPSRYCRTIFVVSGYLLWRMSQVVADAAPRNLVFPKCLDDDMLTVSLDIVRKCRLKAPQPRSVDDISTECVINPVDDGAVHRAAARLMLLFASQRPLRPFWYHGGTYRYGCWEPALVEAERLLDKPGRWEVNDACVDTVRTISRAAIRYLASRCLSASRIKKLKQKLDHFLKALSNSAAALTRELSSAIWQTQFYPPFAAFKTLAHKRSQEQHTYVTVSCRGLRGSRREVFNATLTLLRLISVNFVRETNYEMATAWQASLLNSLLPCALAGVL